MTEECESAAASRLQTTARSEDLPKLWFLVDVGTGLGLNVSLVAIKEKLVIVIAAEFIHDENWPEEI